MSDRLSATFSDQRSPSNKPIIDAADRMESHEVLREIALMLAVLVLFLSAAHASAAIVAGDAAPGCGCSRLRTDVRSRAVDSEPAVLGNQR